MERSWRSSSTRSVRSLDFHLDTADVDAAYSLDKLAAIREHGLRGEVGSRVRVSADSRSLQQQSCQRVRHRAYAHIRRVPQRKGLRIPLPKFRSPVARC